MTKPREWVNLISLYAWCPTQNYSSITSPGLNLDIVSCPFPGLVLRPLVLRPGNGHETSLDANLMGWGDALWGYPSPSDMHCLISLYAWCPTQNYISIISPGLNLDIVSCPFPGLVLRPLVLRPGNGQETLMGRCPLGIPLPLRYAVS